VYSGIVRKISVTIVGLYVQTSVKLVSVIEHDPKSIFRYGATSDLTFGDL